ncbi:hypothetical protein HMPREF1548_04383 [Clostridium sp. KLE 1755]|nr:hypothetical protein HMPREF1548_04383 [Clostridium sp. KLE 1755]
MSVYLWIFVGRSPFCFPVHLYLSFFPAKAMVQHFDPKLC